MLLSTRFIPRVEIYLWQLGKLDLYWTGIALDRLFIGFVWAKD